MRRHLVRSSIGIDQLQFVGVAAVQYETIQPGSRRAGDDGERNDIFAFPDEARDSHRLVQLQSEIDLRALDRADPPGVLDCFRFQGGVFGINDPGIGTLQPWIFQNFDLVIARLLLPILNAVARVRFHFGNACAEDRIVETFGQRQAAILLIRHRQD